MQKAWNKLVCLPVIPLGIWQIRQASSLILNVGERHNTLLNRVDKHVRSVFY